MANYRTVLKLKDYKGHSITRVHKNGQYIYYSDDAITAYSLKEIKAKITEAYDDKECPHNEDGECLYLCVNCPGTRNDHREECPWFKELI